MEQWILNRLNGYVQIQICGNSYDRFLNLCAYHGIGFWKLTASEDAYTAFLLRKDFKKLKTIVKKSHVKICITQKHGLPFFLHKYRKRRGYVLGIAAALLLLAGLSSRIWNISIEGNHAQTDDMIFEYLEQSGIRHGMAKRGMDCKKLAAELKDYFSQFAWTAAELKGTHLIIHIKEGIPEESEEEDQKEPERAQDLVAVYDGMIASIYVRKGRAVVSPGDEVAAGDLLVSGLLPIKNDADEIVAWQQTKADADIIIKREQEYYDELLLLQTKKDYTGNQKNHYLVWIGDHPFSVSRKFGAFEQYELFSSLTQFRLMENFYLPLYIQKFTEKEYENKEYLCTKEQAEEILNANFQYFIKNLEEKGVQIFENDVKIEWNEKSAIASGTIEVGEAAYRHENAMETAKEELLE